MSSLTIRNQENDHLLTPKNAALLIIDSCGDPLLQLQLK